MGDRRGAEGTVHLPIKKKKNFVDDALSRTKLGHDQQIEQIKNLPLLHL